MRKIAFMVLLFSIGTYSQSEKAIDVFDAARYGTVEQVKELELKKPDTINAISPMGFTPLILACYKGNKAVAAYLIPRVKDVDYTSSNGTALAATVVKGNFDLARLLLENKANPNLADSGGMTPLIYAIQFKNKEMVELLLKYNANKKLADGAGKMPFEYAVFTKNQEIINLFKN